MIKVLSIFGTRPEAIKMAPVRKKLEENKEIANIVCVTAQHREMLDQVLEVFDIKPDYDLNIMKQGQTLSDITTRALLGLNEVLLKEKPNIVLVHGDTTTSFVGALAAFYNQIDVGHVEAGLRTWNKYSPFPEEMNRQMVDCIADMYFAPTEKSKQNLLKEGKEETKIYVTGNTAIDAMKFTVKEDYTNEVFDWIGNDRMILLTAHRRENLGEPLYNIFRGIKKAVEQTSLINGNFPKNVRGETYGTALMAEVVGKMPDLQAAIGTNDQEGYVRTSDLSHPKFETPQDALEWQKTQPDSYYIPLYDFQGNEIGSFLRERNNLTIAEMEAMKG